ncbi:hypothetical protein E2C01_065761 [Portunus trituberculatus]|uniref:Uncharacterized protein n=1 Tax=Portunus trituberculatus TaxID=210409 RepID=A0A5B7HMY6_PORTR|nr:hypothetical protein [Portunus trituberculatus]
MGVVVVVVKEEEEEGRPPVLPSPLHSSHYKPLRRHLHHPPHSNSPALPPFLLTSLPATVTPPPSAESQSSSRLPNLSQRSLICSSQLHYGSPLHNAHFLPASPLNLSLAAAGSLKLPLCYLSH